MVLFCCILGCLLFLICIEFVSVFSCTVLFVSISQVIGCEDRLRNDLYCVEWGVKLYSNQPASRCCGVRSIDGTDRRTNDTLVQQRSAPRQVGQWSVVCVLFTAGELGCQKMLATPGST